MIHGEEVAHLGSPATGSPADNRVTILVAEYGAIQALVAQKETASHALVGAYLTLATVILGFVLTKDADPRLMLALPVLSAISGITILRRREDQETANRYIREILRPVAAQCSGDCQILAWNDFYSHYRNARPFFYEFGLQLVFPLSGAAALAAVTPHLNSPVEWWTWLAGLAFLLLLLGAYLRQNLPVLRAAAARTRSRRDRIVRELRARRRA
jgi:hypothetical protein